MVADRHGPGDTPPPDAGGGVRAWLRKRPWIWVVVLFAGVLAINIAMLIIALANQPTVLR